jgi:hypothetical protein
MSRRPARATQADIRRAVQAARQAGAQMVVEITPDGTIRLTPADQNTPKDVAQQRKIVL